MINKLFIEKYQAVLYAVAIVFGLLCGQNYPEFSSSLEIILWPVLAFLLYVTFSQIPINDIPTAIFDYKFILAALIGNFVLIPGLVWGLIALLPGSLELKLGIAMVLLVPCTDWFITFCQMGKGDSKYALALSPILLLIQIVLLPFYIYVMFDESFTVNLAQTDLIEVFIWFIFIPLLAAYITQKLAKTRKFWNKSLGTIGIMPIPLLLIIVFIIFSSQFQIISASRDEFGMLTLIFVLFLIIIIFIAKLMVKIFNFKPRQSRVLVFSFGTRNSFLVLPIVLALPQQFQPAVVAVAFQPLVELVGMLIFIKIIPNIIFKETRT